MENTDRMSVLKPISQENTPKNAQNNNLLKTERILKPDYKLSGRPVFKFSLPGGWGGGGILPLPISCATGYKL